MISSFLSSILVLSPFSFEVSKGFAVEPVVSYSVLDTLDDTALSFGGRLSYIRADQTDAFLTAELSAHYNMLLQAEDGEVYRRGIAEGQILLYEIYNPWAARGGVGGGIERRAGKWNPSFCYRIGLGHYMARNFAIFGDFTGRLILREETATPLEFGFSAQWIF